MGTAQQINCTGVAMSQRMPTTSERWNMMAQTDRLVILSNIYLAGGPIDSVKCSQDAWGELPEKVQNDLRSLSWKR